MMRLAVAFVAGLVLACWLVAGSLCAAADEPVDYSRDIKPIFKERCVACHGALKQQSGLRVDTAALVRKGGDSGPAVELGNTVDSLLVLRVTADDIADRMPPEGKPLTEQQIVLLRTWIKQGAAGPADERPESDPRQHWAFQRPVRPAVPPAGDAAALHPIDALIAAERDRRGLQPVGLADKRLLLRRVYLDLIGLPPTREQLQAFVDDTSSDAYARVVDRLLDSPQYGERWGRHWMDVWRYSDWFGLGAQLRNSQKHIWHWRDWIIESLNADKGYDRMVLDMLAADETAPTDRDALRATGFLARNYFLFNRTTWLDDTIEHTSKAFLGLTMNCTKCHDHKYDPITQADYYRMRAFFEPHQVRLDPQPGETDLEKNGLPRVFDAHPEAPTYLFVRGDEKNPDTSRVLQPGVPAALASAELKIEPVMLPLTAHQPSLQDFVLADHLRVAEKETEDARAALAKAQTQLAAAEKNQPSAPAGAAGEAANNGGVAANTGKVFLKDDFSKANPQVWETGPGQWKYEGGKLLQTQTGLTRAWLRSRENHPADFFATLKFMTTGGDQWRSVGLSFDVANDREKMLYLSAVSPGSKLQLSYKTGANHVYPVEAKQDRPVELNKLYEMTIAVRGRLVNVALNGQHAIAYQLPVDREAGRIDVVAFDAVAEFHAIEIRELPVASQLVQGAPSNSPPSQPASLADAKRAVTVAEKTLAAASLRPTMLRAAHAADLAKHQPTPPGNLQQLIRDAAIAARSYELAKAEENVARAEAKLAAADDKTKVQAEKDLAAARSQLDKAKQAVAQPGDQYPSLQASLKALEGPDETDVSRRKPYPQTSTGRRTALARWIANEQNPLTSRVAVNHIWMRHFGQPLVETPTDFGRRAKVPPQQALLDWLAVEFMESGWSMKHLHRLIVTSRMYQLSSSTVDADPATQQADQDNQYYWRRLPVRMESEVVRDSLLHLAGVLDPAIGGPTIDPAKEDNVYRRSLYFTHSRDDQQPFLSMFDGADILDCYRRSESIVPQQALTLANSKLSLTMARKLAARLQTQLGETDDAPFIAAAFEAILCVQPTPEETTACREALAETKATLLQRNHPQAAVRAKENLVHALLNHNDFITIR